MDYTAKSSSNSLNRFHTESKPLANKNIKISYTDDGVFLEFTET